MKIRTDFFVQEAPLFVLTLVVGIFVAYQYGTRFHASAIRPVEFSWMNALVFVAVFLALSFLLARYRVVARFSFRVFLALVIFFGAQAFFTLFLRVPWDFFAAVALLVITLAARSVWSHDLAVIIGIGSISALLGLSLTPTIALFALIGLSAYDIIAVYKTRHMVELARGMMESGAIFGFIVPAHIRGFVKTKTEAKIGEDFMVLGSGDIGVPLLFACSVVTTSLFSAIVIAVFAVLGLAITHLLFFAQRQRRAMAALPPIATASIIGYLVSLLVV